MFTAGLKDYADNIIDEFDTERTIKKRFYRDDCTDVAGFLVKDLTKVTNDLSKCVIVDNLASNFSLHKENGLHIKSWNGDDDRDKDAK